jgi:hypothetical protein
MPQHQVSPEVLSITCGGCGRALHTDHAAIIWNDKKIDGVNTVTELAVVHQGQCDNKRFICSAGCVYGHPPTSRKSLAA